MRNFTYITVLIITALLLKSCANLKIIERSASEKPVWIYGIEKNYLVGEGSGVDYNEAKYNALMMIKEKIVSSVAQNISFEQNIKVSEKRYKKAIEFLEEYTSKTISKSGNNGYLQGISLSKATDYYWEKHRENHVEKVFYYIKYPFAEKDIKALINEWEEQENLLAKRLEALNGGKDNYTTIESVIEEREELKYLSDFFVDERKTIADISIKKMDAHLNAIRLEPVTDSLGAFEYELMLGKDSLKTNQKPKIKSNCAKIIEVISNPNSTYIQYDYNTCLVENNNFIEICYALSDWELNHKVYFDLSGEKIYIENKEGVTFSSIHRSFFKKDHTIKCHLTLHSKSPVAFKVDKIELLPQLCKRNCNRYYNYKSFPIIIVEDINKNFAGKGNHSFEILVKVPKARSKKWASENGLSTKLSGKIYYSSEITGERKICEFSDLKYFTNW